jgi:hypothetical protein
MLVSRAAPHLTACCRTLYWCVGPGVLGPALVCRGENTPYHNSAFTSGCLSGYQANSGVESKGRATFTCVRGCSWSNLR